MAASAREPPAGPRQAAPVLLSPPSRSATRRGAPLRRPKKQPRPSAPLHAGVVLLGDRLPSSDPALSRPLLPASLSDSFPCSLAESLSLFFSSGNGSYHYSPWSSAIDRLQCRPTRSGLSSPSPPRRPLAASASPAVAKSLRLCCFCLVLVRAEERTSSAAIDHFVSRPPEPDREARPPSTQPACLGLLTDWAAAHRVSCPTLHYWAFA